ncbi:hypothetical protein [Budvicia aquatica]|uniref:hypothetical protein n=1 Tax=Budvicia aquatica TaxID=82979 RepID=UPI0012B564FF|nr:hypothetical protein [Budvicia aquatica]
MSLIARAPMSSAPEEPPENIRLQMSRSFSQVLQQAGWPFVSSIISIRKSINGLTLLVEQNMALSSSASMCSQNS